MRSVVNLYLVDRSVDVVCLDEHWLRNKEINAIILEEYKIVKCFSREEIPRGGTAIFVKSKSLDCDHSFSALSGSIFT